MSDWEGVVLGIVQGATEFLPVSSSGHLVMGQTLLGLTLPGAFFEVAVHVATLLSVVIVYRGRIGRLAVGAAARERDAWRYLGLLVVATVPAAVVGLAFGDAVEGLFERPVVPGVALLVTGGFLWTARAAQRRHGGRPGRAGESGPPIAGSLAGVEADGGVSDRSEARPPGGSAAPGVAAAVVMGLVQVFALVPGISRSGSTVVAGLWMGVGATEAAAFSFLMAVPAIAGAALLQWPELGAGVGASAPGLDAGVLAWAFGAAALTGVVAIRVFVAMLRRRSFHHFALYCWAVGGAFLLYLAIA